jgi:hypothetical protein
MKQFILIISLLILFSCKKEEDILYNLKLSIDKYQQYNNTYFKDVRINLIRVPKNFKKAYYEIRRSNSLGFAVFETRPKFVINKNFYSDSINLDFVSAVNDITKNKSYLLYLIENIKSENPRLEILNKDNKYILFSNDSTANSYLKLGFKVETIDENWKYIKQEFNGEN